MHETPNIVIFKPRASKPKATLSELIRKTPKHKLKSTAFTRKDGVWTTSCIGIRYA